MLNISTGCEPFFALSFNRRTESMNGETYKVEVKAVEEYRKATGNKGSLPSYFITSADIPWKERIDIQAALQEYCDTAISSTVNLPKETTIEDVKELYKYAWKKGLKGVTIYRDGSRDPILSVDPIQTESPHSLPTRGEIIKAGNDCIGLKRVLMTGCGSLHVNAYFDPISGELRECFLSKGSTGGCQNFMIGLSRMISLSARGGISIDNILDQLKSCGVCPSYAVRSATKKIHLQDRVVQQQLEMHLKICTKKCKILYVNVKEILFKINLKNLNLIYQNVPIVIRKLWQKQGDAINVFLVGIVNVIKYDFSIIFINCIRIHKDWPCSIN